jgi:hypothetical protein
VKKIFGVMHEYENYKGLICTDDEIEFIQNFDGKALLEKFINKKHFAATRELYRLPRIFCPTF